VAGIAEAELGTVAPTGTGADPTVSILDLRRPSAWPPLALA